MTKFRHNKNNQENEKRYHFYDHQMSFKKITIIHYHSAVSSTNKRIGKVIVRDSIFYWKKSPPTSIMENRENPSNIFFCCFSLLLKCQLIASLKRVVYKNDDDDDKRQRSVTMKTSFDVISFILIDHYPYCAQETVIAEN